MDHETPRYQAAQAQGAMAEAQAAAGQASGQQGATAAQGGCGICRAVGLIIFL